MVQLIRLLLQKGIGPAFEDATLAIDGEVSPLRIQKHFNILSFQAFADFESLTEQVNVAVGGDLAEESDPSGSNR